jgi:hypothetical protein
VEAVARKLVGCDIVSDVAGRCAFGQQVSDEVAELLLRSGDVLTSMQECRAFSAAGPAQLVVNKRVGLEHRFEPLGSVTSLVPDFSEMFEVASVLTWVASVPALTTSKRSPARWRSRPSAICERAELWVHRNRTLVRSPTSAAATTHAPLLGG